MKSTLVFQDQLVIELRSDDSRLLVSPGHGARILLWEHAGRPVITWPADADWSRMLKVRGGNPVLFPFIARHFVDGKIDFWRDAEGVVRPMPIHGFARDARFAVVDDARGETVRMRLVDSDATRKLYPFAFQFDVVVALRGAKLEIAFETTNRGDGPLPYYAGHHLYFAVPHAERADWKLHLPCTSWGRQNPDGSIQREPAGAGVFSLDDSAAVDRFQIEPLDPRLTLENARRGQRVVFNLQPPNSIPWYAVTTWTEKPDSDFYCVEPWLGLPNAIHHGEGLRRLGPGETERAALELDASGW
jgi:galactose mutarotase-like enzyme